MSRKIRNSQVRFLGGGGPVTVRCYPAGMVVVSILLIPLALLMHQILVDEKTPYLTMATVFGVLAGVMNFLGFIRWIFVVPHLASVYVDPASSKATRDAVVVVFDAFHLYAGFSLGEHLGFLFTGLWVLLISLAMLRSPLFKVWLGWLGIVATPLIIFGSTEGAGLEIAADVNVLGFALWSIWLIAAGIFLLRAKAVAPSNK